MKEKKRELWNFLPDEREAVLYENYPEIVVESGSLDQVILMLTGGER